MAKNRDDFTPDTKRKLAERVAYRCSNPNCPNITIGPNTDENKSTNSGIAAHITSAAPGGARYDSSLTPEQRIHISNGIWLCSNCAGIIDRDEQKYPVELLKKWKIDTERQVEKEQQNSLNEKKDWLNTILKIQFSKPTNYIKRDIILCETLLQNEFYYMGMHFTGLVKSYTI